jgi:hypothetical protein
MKSFFLARSALVGGRAIATSTLIATLSFTLGAGAQEPAGAPPAVTAPAETPPAPSAPAEATEPPKTEPTAVAPATPPPAAASEAPPAADAAAPPEPPPPPPYSLPWQLRPATAGTVLRLDTAFAFYENPTTHNSGSTIAPMLLFSYKIVKGFAPLVRLGLVSNSPPDTVPPAAPAESGFAFLNPVLGATYALELSKQMKLAFFLGLTIPVGTGGGDSPDAGDKAALSAGIRARSAMDNAMFSVNDFTIFPGVDFAFVSGGFTVQAEATLLQLSRVRGSGDPTTDPSKTNFTMGLHAGYFFIPMLSLGAEIRHQRFLSTPKAVEATPANRDTTTIAVGPRFHFQIAKGKWLRPGIAFAFGIDEPLTKSSYKIVQLDIPFAF